MCNEYGNRIPYRRYVEEFSHLKLRLSVSGNGPDLSPRDESISATPRLSFSVPLKAPSSPT